MNSILKKQHRLLECFVKEPWKKFTMKDVRELSGIASQGYLFDSLKDFTGQGILKEEKVGRASLFLLDIDSSMAQSVAGFVAESMARRMRKIPFSEIEKFSGLIGTDFFVLIVAGSYANGTQKETSDLDIVAIVDDSAETKKIYSRTRLACELSIPQIHLYVFRKSEFLEMLLDEEPNYGKEIARKNLILFGGSNYYRMMKEAISNGFNDKKLH